MSDHNAEPKRVLAIHPIARGLGFAVLEGPGRLIDWGTKDTKTADNAAALSQIGSLAARYRPDVLVLEDVLDAGSRRRARVRELLKVATKRSASWRVETHPISRGDVRKAFRRAGATTKPKIAATIAEHFPELSPRIPPVRKPWMSEDARMGIFDAVAFGLTFLYLEE